jgi:beta-glucosidase
MKNLYFLISMSVLLSCTNRQPWKENHEQKIQAIVDQMTTEEKLRMIGGVNYMESYPLERLGIPAMVMGNGPSGIRPWKTPNYSLGLVDEYYKATTFPAGIALAATWNTDLLYQVGNTIGKEANHKDIQVLLGPCVNIVRNPYSGRNFESYGEDPYLASRMVVSFVQGVQAEKVMATTKHYIANNQDYNRFDINNSISERAQREIYLPAYKAAVREGRSASIMSAYPRINGTFCSENRRLLTEILKDEWGFDGFVMSDWWAVKTGLPTALAGLDIEMPSADYMHPDTLRPYLEDGTFPMALLDDKLRRMLRKQMEFDLFDPASRPPGSMNIPVHHNLARRAAMESMVLLKNEDNVLPLDRSKLNKLLVVGPSAVILRAGGGGSCTVPAIHPVTPHQSIIAELGSDRVVFQHGFRMKDDIFPITADLVAVPGGDKRGFHAEYFNNPDFEGNPSIVRVDSTIAFDWSQRSPGNGVPADDFSARWTGSLKVDETGAYEISVLTDNQMRVYIDDQPVLDSKAKVGLKGTDLLRSQEVAQGRVKRAVLNLSGDRAYALKVEYIENKDKSTAVFGFQPYKTRQQLKDAALADAGDADAVVVFAGISNQYESEGHDLESISLPEIQQDIIAELAARCEKMVVVMHNGTPLLVRDWIDMVPALIEAWYPGQAGDAIAPVLFGDVSPSGKLPFTIPRRWEDCPASSTYPPEGNTIVYEDGIYVGYRHYDTRGVQPEFPFGFGLTYTTFEYQDIRVNGKRFGAGDTITVQVTLRNTGDVDAAEVVQLYVQDVESSLPRPAKELKAFDRVELKAGEQGSAKMKVAVRDLAFYDPQQSGWVHEPGEYKLFVGASSVDIHYEQIIRAE